MCNDCNDLRVEILELEKKLTELEIKMTNQFIKYNTSFSKLFHEMARRCEDISHIVECLKS